MWLSVYKTIQKNSVGFTTRQYTLPGGLDLFEEDDKIENNFSVNK
jgi:hypothetical protein